MVILNYSTLISTEDFSAQVNNPTWVTIDCRFSLAEPESGRQAHEKAHIPGSIYAHLDQDLSGPIITGQTGRHPLPEVDVFSNRLGHWGVGPGVQVVLYDDSGGAIAARLWWMLRWLGHDAVAVLNGGWPLWVAEGRPTQSGLESYQSRRFTPRPRPSMLISTRVVNQKRNEPGSCLYDSRSADRYRGENETIDPVAGHIPGATSAPYLDNIDPSGLFFSQEHLRNRFLILLDGQPPEKAIFYCGSGVTAAHNLLALAYAGLGNGRLYAGSWSEWITDPSRPVSRS